MISRTQRPLHDNTKLSQQTDLYAPGGIRSHNPSKRSAADLRFIDRAATGTGHHKMGYIHNNVHLIWTASGDFIFSVRTFEGTTAICSQRIVGYILTFRKWYYVKFADCGPLQVARKVQLQASKPRKLQSLYSIFCNIFTFQLVLPKMKSV